MQKKDVRLQKYMAECGIASRRKAEEMIAQGRVRVNGRPVQIGQSVVPGRDRVTVDGVEAKREKNKIYIALNKPRGYVTTMSDELGRKCVVELLGKIPGRVYPVGRLDRDSEGLLLLTDDGEFANAMMHPRNHVPKIYRASIRPGITDSQLARFESGVELDGRMTAPARAKIIREEPGRAVVEITLTEGRNRQIRRMFESFGIEVARLNRVAVGTVRLGGLKPGEYRELAANEIHSLRKAAGLIGPRAARPASGGTESD